MPPFQYVRRLWARTGIHSTPRPAIPAGGLLFVPKAVHDRYADVFGGGRGLVHHVVDGGLAELLAFNRIAQPEEQPGDERDLENAIEHISPTQPGERLQTGARELTGLENAVNGLLVRMRESYRQKAQFVSDASHELRTPIAVIQGYAHLLARWGKDDSQVLDESIAAIQSESDYMKKLVEELLFLARGEIGRNPFEPKPIRAAA